LPFAQALTTLFLFGLGDLRGLLQGILALFNLLAIYFFPLPQLDAPTFLHLTKAPLA
jgi:hypothetical protein